MDLNHVLLFLHFVGLAMGMAVPFSNLVMAGLIDAAAPSEKSVLLRFPPKMSRIGDIGLVLLWVTGLTLLFTKYGGFAAVPWQFHVKLTLVVVLTGLVGFMHSQRAKALAGDAGARSRMEIAGKIAFATGLAIILFAVLTFNQY